MASRLADSFDEDIISPIANRSKIGPVQTRRKLGNFKMTDSLVAIYDKKPVPNHLLNTS